MFVSLKARYVTYEVAYSSNNIGKRRRESENVSITRKEGSGAKEFQNTLYISVDLIPELCALLNVIYKGKASG